MKEKTIFEKIIDNEIPSVKIYEDDICIVIMDKFPETKGKCLVITKEPIDYVFDLSEETYLHIMKITKTVVAAVDKALTPYRTCILVEGFEVPHSHIKIYPTYSTDPVYSGGHESSVEELEEVAEKIRKFL